MFQETSNDERMHLQAMLPPKKWASDVIDSEGILTVGRQVHNEYIISFYSVMLMVLRANHDIRFLIGTGTTDAIYYCLKYLTKVQEAIDSGQGILLASYDRRQEYEPKSNDALSSAAVREELA